MRKNAMNLARFLHTFGVFCVASDIVIKSVLNHKTVDSWTLLVDRECVGTRSDAATLKPI